jgi:hypothetical protein
MKNFRIILTAVAAYCTFNYASAHGGNPKLHINPRWEECSFQLDSSLTKDAWRQFTKEAGLVTYFRSLTDAKPMGAGRFEFAILQWSTSIDEGDEAWNNTFVHPDSTHWLIGGDALPFPGLMLRAGITSRIDGGVYWSERPGANYGVFAGQVQYSLINDTVKNWAAATRLNFSSLYGPADLNLYVYGMDLLASKKFGVISDWGFVSPYAGISAYVSHSHEKTEAVNLEDELEHGMQGMAGAVMQLSIARIGVEYNFANTNTLSYKLGVNFKF